ncbi:MAG: hypothetical protein FWB86_07965 [Treponema sp.]|nr:hypothetical protein [Treponema sp.]MCL2252166.1 hypothetical protein [Treponema sp.]
MARYKETEKGVGLFLSVNLSEQLLTGTFEWTLNAIRQSVIDTYIMVMY